MNKAEWLQALQNIFTHKVLTDEPMRRHTTWKIGGPADYMVFPSSEEEMAQALALLDKENIPRLVIGNGSNILVGDKGIRGVVLKMGEPFSASVWRDNEVEACSGMLLASLALEAAERSCAGVEFSRGIPGSVGGAVRMNAGAYGNTIGQFVTEVEALSYSGEKIVLKADDITFAYRDSSLFQLDAIITRVRLRLIPGDREEIMAKIKEFSQKRSFNQPLEFPSCGSVFRNPPNDHAGRLIEMAHLRGNSIGGAAVSKKHGNFIINLGGARACDVRALMEEVQDRVFEYSGIRLETEVKMIGQF